MFYFSAHKNYCTADDVAYAARCALMDVERSMTDEEFLAYLEAAAQHIERVAGR
jgi:glycerol kinase